MLIDKPGVHSIPEDVYHADAFLPAPSLSTSIAKVILEKTPRHAWWKHPRLNPAYEGENREIFDVGSAAHSLILGDEKKFAVIDAADWRTKAAKEARDLAYADGKIPLKASQWADVKAMAGAARAQLAAHEEAQDAFRPGTGVPETTMAWLEGKVWCRARLDWLPNDGRVFYDYKSTGGSASPEQWQRGLYDRQYDIQAAFYRRGIRKLLGIPSPAFHFVVQETEPPYCLSVLGVPPMAIDMAERKVLEAIKWWGWCLENDTWPGYDARTCYVEPPPWHEKQWLEREERDQMARERGGDDAVFRQMIVFQSPLFPRKEKEPAHVD